MYYRASRTCSAVAIEQITMSPSDAPIMRSGGFCLSGQGLRAWSGCWFVPELTESTALEHGVQDVDAAGEAYEGGVVALLFRSLRVVAGPRFNAARRGERG